MTATGIARLRLAALLLSGLILQITLLSDLRVMRACPDLLLLISVCAGLAAGSELGAIVGFSAGLLADLFLTTTPFGLSAFTFAVVGYAIGNIRQAMIRESWILPPVTAFIGTLFGLSVFVAAGAVVGQSQLTRPGPAVLTETFLIVGAMNAVLAMVVFRIVDWAAIGTAGAANARVERSSLMK